LDSDFLHSLRNLKPEARSRTSWMAWRWFSQAPDGRTVSNNRNIEIDNIDNIDVYQHIYQHISTYSIIEWIYIYRNINMRIQIRVIQQLDTLRNFEFNSIG
jgi:hypothetical protein